MSAVDDEPALVVRQLRREFDGGAVAVDDLSFTVRRGEVVGLLGANGAGKTTAMNIILGLMHPTAGEVGFSAWTRCDTASPFCAGAISPRPTPICRGTFWCGKISPSSAAFMA